MARESFFKILVFLANFSSSLVVFLVHIATFQNKKDSHCLVVPVAASVHFVIIKSSKSHWFGKFYYIKSLFIQLRYNKY